MYFYCFCILLTICKYNAANTKKISFFKKKFSFIFGCLFLMCIFAVYNS